jgi:hypothetical protein
MAVRMTEMRVKGKGVAKSLLITSCANLLKAWHNTIKIRYGFLVVHSE